MFEKNLELISNQYYLLNSKCVDQLVRKHVSDVAIAESTDDLVKLSARFAENLAGFHEYVIDPEWHNLVKLGRWAAASFGISSRLSYLETMKTAGLVIANEVLQIIKDSGGQEDDAWQSAIDDLVMRAVKVLMGIEYPG